MFAVLSRGMRTKVLKGLDKYRKVCYNIQCTGKGIITARMVQKRLPPEQAAPACTGEPKERLR